MFPLGCVLFPSVMLPLHVFEPRYRALMRHCLDGRPEFGVVLIERGREVGGGDVRTDVGTVARVQDAVELPDGRWVVATVGTTRVRVVRWLTDDPYPRADVDEFPDPPGGDATADAERYGQVVGLLRRGLALSAELGVDAVPATVELTDDPALGSFQVAAAAPIGPADEFRVLATAAPGARLDLLSELLTARNDDLERHLALG